MTSPSPPPLASSARWSVLARDTTTGEVLLEHAPDALLSAASVPKLLLLLACAAGIERGEIDPDERLDRANVAPVGDSGLWQHLAQQTLTVDDAALLVGAVSDNLATNALLERVGLDAIALEAERLGIRGVQLHDAVRERRGPADPPRLSTASATGLVELLSGLASGQLGAPGVSARVLGWMRHSVDLSMVASAFGHDPLAHGAHPSSAELFVKTGTDDGVRADAGIVRTAERTLVYAAIANWEPASGARDAVLVSMRAIGERVQAAVER